MDGSGDLAQTAAYWDKLADQFFKDEVTRREEWQAHPAAAARRFRLLGDCDALGWLTTRLPPGRIERALGAGCGVASFEIQMLHQGLVEHFDLYDVSSVCLEAATERAHALGVGDRITVHCGDLLGADRDGYGLVTFVASLHHAVDVEATVRFAHDILSPAGMLFADEYIGLRR